MPTTTPLTRKSKLKPGSVVRCRTRRYLVEEVQQCIPLLIDEIVGADQAVDTYGMGRDAVGGQHSPHHPFHTLAVVLDLRAVLSEDPLGDVFRGCRSASSKQLHQHQRLIDVRHPHPLVDVLGEAVVST